MPRKAGPNFEDKNRIKEWLEVGASAPEIDQNLNIEEGAVQRYVDSLKPKRTRKPKTVDVSVDEEVTDNGSDGE
jgi:hypothetical protein